MSSKESNSDKPKTFGEKFKEDGLVGMLRKKKDGDKSDPNAMHFLEHLEELRWVILKAVVAFLLGCIGVAVFMQDSVKLLQMPLVKAVEDFGEIDIDLQSIGLEQYAKPLQEQGVDLKLLRDAREGDLKDWGITDPHHQTRILSHFSVGKNRNLLQVIRSFSPIFIAMKICFLGGIGISLPLIFYFVGSFVVPGLTPQEKRVFFPGCIAATFLFLAGASMTYFIILPYSLAFTIEFSFNVLGLDVYRPEAGNYYSLVIWMTFAVGVAFQFPLVLILLVKIGMLSVTKLRNSRRMVLVILMVSAALITPGGDPVSLCILTIPLYILYELAIITGAMVERAKLRKEWAEWDESIQGPRPPKPKREKLRWVLYLIVLLTLGGGGAFVMQNKESFSEFIDELSSIFEMSEEESPSVIPGTMERNSSKTTMDQNSSKAKVDGNSTQVSTAFPPGKEFFLQLTPVDGNLTDGKDMNATGNVYRAIIKER